MNAHLRIALASIIATIAAAQEPAPPKPFEVWRPNRPKTEAEHRIAKWGPRGLPSPGYAFVAAKVLPITAEPIADGVVITRNGLIEAVGPLASTPIPADYQRIDCGDAWICPGFIDLHCHVASESFDLNDTVHPTNPEFRTLDLVTLDHDQINTARAGGITSVLYIPGSGSNMGGFGTLTKTGGNSPDEALIRFPGSLKIAQAGNPERQSGDLGRDMMGMSQGIRLTLLDGKRYHEAHLAFEAGKGPEPKFDPTLELIRGLFRHEYFVSVHTQIYQVVLQTLQQLRLELGLWTVIVHGTFDGYRLSEDMADAGLPVAGGPRQYYFNPRTGEFEGLLSNWSRGGKHGWREPVRGLGMHGIGVNTDSPVVAQEQLPLQAAMAVRLGLPHQWALRGITINAATFAGIEHRVGSLTVGKDADLAIWTGDPLDPRSHVERTVINGVIRYQRNARRPGW
ncbi:MAG: amidohydrolase family protein [Planctomycetes bacterium]|nr:amidohydrolase family protein [Planctomycetota bacterium]